MCTLSAVYQSLLRSPQGADVQLCEPPTYIRTLADPPPHRKIVLIYKQGAATQTPAATNGSGQPYRKPASRRRNSAYEVTGTPLEDDCEIDAIDEALLEALQPDGKRLWTGDEEALLPVPLDSAVQLLHSVIGLPCTDGAVWTLCKSTAEPDLLLQMWRYEDHWQTRGLVRFTGLQHYRDIDLVRLRSAHRAYMGSGGRATAAAVQTHIEAHFDIQPTLTMRLTWDAPATAAASALAGYRKAAVVVTQTVRIGQGGSAADDHWRQLLRLALIKDQICAYREREDRQRLVYQSGSELSLQTIRERVQRILSDVPPVAGGDEMREAIELEPVIRRSLKRDLVDITDQLWMLLKLCASYEDLKTAFNYIFLCAANCSVANTPTSSNHLAVLIREISEQRLAVPCLSGAEPLELLLEIGLEKALRDYEHIFTESKLCSAKELRAAVAQQSTNATRTGESVPAANSRQTMLLRNQRLDDDTDEAVGLQNSTFARAICEQKMARLAHMHLLMEHMLSIQIHLNWTDMHDYVLVDLSRPAKPFAVYQTLVADKRDIPIGCPNVISKVERTEPNLLKVRMHSQNHFTTVENVFVYSKTPLFPPNAFPQMQMDEPTPESPAYSGVNYLKLGTRK